MFCPKCGTQVNDGAAFCNVCGTNLQAAAAPAPAYSNPAYAAPKAPNPAASQLLSGKKVDYKDFDFLFVVIAGIFAFFATVLMHCPMFSIGAGSYSTQMTLCMLGGGTNAIGQIIFTLLTFASLAYLFLPYFKGVPLKLNVLNYVVLAAILFFQLILFVVGGLMHKAGSMVSLSMDGWLFWLCTIVSIGTLAYLTIKYVLEITKK